MDTSALLARKSVTRRWPVLTSVGDALRRPHYLKTHFHKGLRHKLGAKGPLMLDSGGFALMTGGEANWPVEGVIDIYREVNADVFVSLDLPVTSGDDNEEASRKLMTSASNFEVMSGELGEIRLMPVIHGRTEAECERACSLTRKVNECPAWVGIGGLVPLLKNAGRDQDGGAQRRREQFFRRLWLVRTVFPDSLIHIFGAGATRFCLAAFAMGAHSVDSIAWRQAAGFGSIMLPGTGQRILKWDRPGKRPRPIVDDRDRALIAKCRCPTCLGQSFKNRLARLSASFEYRAYHNAWVMRRETALLRLAAQLRRQDDFLKTRLPARWLDAMHV